MIGRTKVVSHVVEDATLFFDSEKSIFPSS